MLRIFLSTVIIIQIKKEKYLVLWYKKTKKKRMKIRIGVRKMEGEE